MMSFEVDVDCYRHTYQKKVNKGEVVMEEETKSKSLSKMISVVISEKRIYLYMHIKL